MTKEFEGIVCFGGEDWWYHNRGHYDMQMMRELSGRVPVLYVNSIGMRTPRLTEGRMFLARVARKLKSFARGLRIPRKNFGVFSPITVPMLRGSSLFVKTVGWGVRRASRKMAIRRPLLWVACPPAAPVIQHIPGQAVVYQRTDRFECFPGVRCAEIKEYDVALKSTADVTLFCSRLLFEEERGQCKNALFVDHGVDFEKFVDAAENRRDPGDVATIPGPRIGFVGGVDVHSFNSGLFLQVAAMLPDCSFVVVGACSLPQGWCALPNVHLLGQRQYDQVAMYMASCDVLIVPWNVNPWVEGANPVKLKEYLAAGKPIVTTPLEAVKSYSGLMRVGRDAAEFAQGIRDALRSPPDPKVLRDRVRNETWSAKAAMVLEELERLDVRPAAT